MKKTLIVGNWKMNLGVHEASLLVKRLNDHIPVYRDIEVVLAPSLLTLQPISQEIDRRKFKLAAQNAYFKDEGAFTGEVSFTMLRDLVQYAIVGHSERRIYFNETLEVVRDKVQAAIRNGISPILCVGETKQERAAGETKRVIHDQVTTALSNLTAEDVENVVIAYEPVWAISTFGGELAKPDQVKQVIDQIRYQVKELYGAVVAEDMRVIYGGSVDDQTAGGYLQIEGVDGCLPGSASLNYAKFSGIVEKAYALKHKDTKNG
ncbi:MAG TPA: triose-phosphate isomerase [Candidatus Saccharimonadales bacterium]|jgi:triosephosphate isomerase|nr:triose-phosphate isomerase [Candidatus Saccharimonadales bacterium]